ncbi:YlmH family RNA-binding protein [Ornithinibacillus halophilus]|uniref:RNA-binding protein YlmH, contains S4-like domain n=1 Tax=Ornithinibacillus halophilus TaxID=930117 RepID=A0A1M5C4Y5_9BACI|nr:YlmH/Sll1252 family protein [Ornithinibacillus halophilus]SHF49834.1 RNA-binding protein YlmH, contains S4-like domain [Ornithinibacillus halophilus]
MDIYQHFRKDEHEFIDQVLSWKEEVERSFQRRLTNFLDPRQQQILEDVIGSTNDEIQIKFFGGGQYSERRRAIIAPYYEEIEIVDFQLALIQASYNVKFISLAHRDIMGAFLSLGLKREKLGDIYVDNGIIQIIMADEISSYVLTNLTGIKRANLTFEEKPLSNFTEKEPEWIETDKTVSSLRLDALIKEIYNVSRKDATEFIKKKFVKVNFKVVEDAKFTLQENDIISLRGKGRSKFVHYNGTTKKDKLRITIAKLQD